MYSRHCDVLVDIWADTNGGSGCSVTALELKLPIAGTISDFGLSFELAECVQSYRGVLFDPTHTPVGPDQWTGAFGVNQSRLAWRI